MPGTPRVVCAGLATYDVIQLVERLPSPDEKVAALSFVTAAGGPAANAAVACAYLAARDAVGSRPTLVTALPQHPLSSLIADDLLGCGVDVAVVATYEGAPITASIMVTRGTGERAVVSPTSSATDDELVPDVTRARWCGRRAHRRLLSHPEPADCAGRSRARDSRDSRRGELQNVFRGTAAKR